MQLFARSLPLETLESADLPSHREKRWPILLDPLPSEIICDNSETNEGNGIIVQRSDAPVQAKWGSFRSLVRMLRRLCQDWEFYYDLSVCLSFKLRPLY